MKYAHYIAWIALAGVLTIGALLILRGKQERKAFIVNQQVFNAFTGTQELEIKLEAEKARNAAYLDSISRQWKDHSTAQSIQELEQLRFRLSQREEQLREQYTSELWATINTSLAAYGKEKNYDFIFGATGNGSLMYARESENITEDVIRHINKQYEIH